MKVNLDTLRKHVKITLLHEDEDEDFHTHFDDPDTVVWIQEQLQKNNYWAWFTAHIIGEFGGLRAENWLCGCSYESEKNFREDEYYESMVEAVTEELAQNIEKLFEVHGLLETEGSLCLQCVVA